MTTKINRLETGLFSKISNQLVYHQDEFQSFIQTPFSKEAFDTQIKIKSSYFTAEKRQLLVQELTKQYANLDATKTLENIALLKDERTFTITTGHQLSLFTGPLFSIFKIMHIIKMCEELKSTYSAYNFIPVFWMATEDHDFEEINHFYLFGNKKSWESNQTGPVGRFDVSMLSTIREELHDFFKNNPDSEIHQLIDSYDGKNLSEAHFKLCHRIFKDYGLVIIEADNSALKRSYLPVMKKEIFEQVAESRVQQTTSELEKMGYSGQVFPRAINFFYIEKGFRERIQPKDDGFFIEGKGNFSKEELENMMEQHPESFSPNVIFRPIYQEAILPNLCYVGGGGEMAYWLQLKDVFDAVGVPYPLIQVRNSLQLLDKGLLKRMTKLNMSFNDFLGDVEQIKKDYIEKNSEDDFDFTSIQELTTKLTSELQRQIIPIDPQMKQFIEIENNKLDKQIDGIHKRVIRVQKQKLEGAMNQIDAIKEKLFPINNLQERVDNFLNFCPSGDYQNLIHEIYQAVDPFNGDFIVVEL